MIPLFPRLQVVYLLDICEDNYLTASIQNKFSQCPETLLHLKKKCLNQALLFTEFEPLIVLIIYYSIITNFTLIQYELTDFDNLLIFVKRVPNLVRISYPSLNVSE